MAILFSQADGSDQHYDTYEEFEQAFVLLKRLNGEEVPQDLLDEVKAKYGDNETKPIHMEIDGTELAEAFRKATEGLSKGFAEISKVRSPISNEGEIKEDVRELLPEGTKVKLLHTSECGDLRVGEEGTITGIDRDCRKYLVYRVRVRDGIEGFGWLREGDVEVIKEDPPTEFRMGDLVRVLETFEDSFGDVAGVDTIQEVVTNHDNNTVLGVGRVLIGDNHDKLQIVCRREDRKDIEL